MKKVLIILALITLTLGTSLEDQQIEQGRQLFKQLNEVGDLGKDIMQTILLELQNSSNENVLDRVIKMLHELKDSIESQQQDFKTESDKKQANCMSKVKDLQVDVDDLRERVDKAKLLIPPKQEEMDNFRLALETLKTTQDSYAKELLTLDTYAAEKLARYVKTRDEHDALIAALEQGRKIVLQLKNDQPKAFLQQRNQNVMLQLEQHGKKTEFLAQHHKPIFEFVFSLLQQSQADQGAVDKVVQIIDDLLSAESKARNIEYQAEQLRLAKFEFDRNRYVASIDEIKAKTLEILSDQTSLNTRLEEQKKDIEGWIQMRKSKLTQISDHNKICVQDASNLIKRTEKYDKILEILRQVIILMEHSSIQGVRGMVKDMDPDAILAKDKPASNAFVEEKKKKFDFTESDRIANTILADVQALDKKEEGNKDDDIGDDY